MKKEKTEKKSVKTKKEKPSETKPSEGHHPVSDENESEKPFDFGGLPHRDLKKNLGCG